MRHAKRGAGTVAELMAETMRRAEDRAAKRYERALASLLKALEPSMGVYEAQERARRAWDDAK